MPCASKPLGTACRSPARVAHAARAAPRSPCVRLETCQRTAGPPALPLALTPLRCPGSPSDWGSPDADEVRVGTASTPVIEPMGSTPRLGPAASCRSIWWISGGGSRTWPAGAAPSVRKDSSLPATRSRRARLRRPPARWMVDRGSRRRHAGAGRTPLHLPLATSSASTVRRCPAGRHRRPAASRGRSGARRGTRCLRRPGPPSRRTHFGECAMLATGDGWIASLDQIRGLLSVYDETGRPLGRLPLARPQHVAHGATGHPRHGRPARGRARPVRDHDPPGAGARLRRRYTVWSGWTPPPNRPTTPRSCWNKPWPSRPVIRRHPSRDIAAGLELIGLVRPDASVELGFPAVPVGELQLQLDRAIERERGDRQRRAGSGDLDGDLTGGRALHLQKLDAVRRQLAIQVLEGGGRRWVPLPARLRPAGSLPAAPRRPRRRGDRPPACRTNKRRTPSTRADLQVEDRPQTPTSQLQLLPARVAGRFSVRLAVPDAQSERGAGVHTGCVANVPRVPSVLPPAFSATSRK